MTTRLHLMYPASISSVRSIAFSTDKPMDTRGRESLCRLSGPLPSCDIVLCSPALRAAQTAERFALEVQAQAPEAVAGWLENPHGESFSDVMTRVGGWMDCLLAGSGSVLAILRSFLRRSPTHLAVAPRLSDTSVSR
jgi:broad specificity phosphatase PhoE